MQTDWKERLKNWAPEPPEGAWGRLSDALPQNEPPVYAKKLHDFTETPPPAAWSAIEQQLHTKKELAPVVQMGSRKKWMRIAAVAASVIALFVLAQPFFSSQNDTDTIPTNSTATQQQIGPLEQLIDRGIQTTENIISGKQQSQGNAAQRYIAGVLLPPKPSDPLPVLEADDLAGEPFYEVTNAGSLQMDNSLVERYIALPVTEDEGVRLSKKLYSIYRCEEQPDPSACFERLSAMRSRMATPSLLATADFGGIMEVIQSVGADQ